MFGKNPIRRYEESDGQQLWIQEVFYTIQGEGPFAGRPSVFVRLAGCNLACHYCDTDFESSTWKPTLEELVAKIHEEAQKWGRGPKLVVLTGGEPLRQNVVPLIQRLVKDGAQVQIETAGTILPPTFEMLHGLSYRHSHSWTDPVSVVVSPKTPALNRTLLPFIHALKYIVSVNDCSKETGLPDSSTQKLGQVMDIATPASVGNDFPLERIFIQPCDVGDPEKNLLNILCARDIAMKHGYTLSLQIHKIIDVP